MSLKGIISHYQKRYGGWTGELQHQDLGFVLKPKGPTDMYSAEEEHEQHHIT